jgi:hypothetical protein
MTRLALAMALALPPAVQAGGLGSLATLAQSEFRALAEDLGAAAAYKGVTPATPLGLTGFDIGVELSSTSVENSRLLGLAGAGSQSEITVPKLHVYKGLPWGLDLGAFVAGMPDLSGSLYGVDARWALVDDSGAVPAVALRASGTRTSGLGADLATLALDVVVSKKFALATPYAGGGMVRISADPGIAGLAEETFSRGRTFVGLNVNLAVINVAVEAERMGSNTTLSAKLGWRF